MDEEEDSTDGDEGPSKDERDHHLITFTCPLCRQARPPVDYFGMGILRPGNNGCVPPPSDGTAMSSASTCKECISALLGLKVFPRCRACGRRGGTCLTCLPEGRLWEDAWAPRDRPAARALRGCGIGIFDGDPFLRGGDDDGDKFAPLPPAEGLAGAYDVVFARWETSGTETITSMDYGDVLMKRTIGGTLRITCAADVDGSDSESDSDNDSEDDDRSSYKRLAGCVRFDECAFFEDQQEDGDLAVNHPYGNLLFFRFSEDFDMDGSWLEAHGADESCAAAGVLLPDDRCLSGFEAEDAAGTRRVLDDLPLSSRTWGGSYGSEVGLRVVGRRAAFPWVPRDHCESRGDLYARRMLGLRRDGAARATDWSCSWLHRRMRLPEATVELVHSFVRSDLALEFVTLPDDVLLTFSFEEYSSSLEAHVIARRRIEKEE